MKKIQLVLILLTGVSLNKSWTFVLPLNSRSRNLPVDLFIICCESQFGYQRRTLYISTGKPDFSFLNLCKLQKKFCEALPLQQHEAHTITIELSVSIFPVLFVFTHELLRFPESNVRCSLFLQISSSLCVLLLCSGMYNIFNMLFTIILINTSCFTLPTHVVGETVKHYCSNISIPYLA